MYALVDATFIAVIKPFIDEGFGGQASQIPTGAGGLSNLDLGTSGGFNSGSDVLMMAPFVVIVLFSLRGLANFLSTYCISYMSARVIMDLRQEVFEHYLTLPVSYIDSENTGNLISRVTYDTEQIAIIPMGFCYPGKGKSGDLPPRKECAPKWHQQLFDFMPNLELIMHGGVSLAPYREELERLVGKKVNYIEVFNASEGSFAIQDQPEHLGMLLMVDYGIFYEFLPMNSSENSIPLTLSEVKLNTTYAIVITTNSGLWRYQLGDTIQFTTLKPFRIKIVGRTKQYINSFGEELMVHNAEKALELCCERWTCSVKEFTVGPRLLDAGSCGFHDWYIEFEHPPNQLVDFENDLDAILQELNSDYEAKRHKNYILKNLKIKSLKENTFYNWMKSKGKLGGQHKVPRLSNSSQFLDEIDAFLQDNISTKKP